MRRSSFLTVTAVVELAAGLGLLVLPGAALWLLLGVTEPDAVGTFTGRVAGAALVALGVASGFGRAADLGLLGGLLFYNGAVAALLVYAGAGLGLTGVALWPAVGLHTALAAWCGRCLRG